MINVPLRCPKADTCNLKCADPKVQATDKKVDVLFVVDKYHKESIDTLQSILKQRYKKESYAITYVMRYFGKSSTECKSALSRDVKRLNPEFIVFIGDRGFRVVTGNDQVNEIDGRGYYSEVDIAKRTIPSILTMHPSYFKVNPAVVSLFLTDLDRAFSKSLRSMKIEKADWTILKTLKEAEGYIDYLMHETKNPSTALDTETQNVNKKYSNKIATFQFCDDGKKGYVLPWAHKETPWGVHELKILKPKMKKLFLSENTKMKAWITHNGKFELHRIYSEFGVVPSQFVLDTQVGAWLLNENINLLTGGFVKLEDLLAQFGASKYADVDPELERARKEGRLFDQPLKKLAKYGAGDAVYTHQRFQIQKEEARVQNYLNQFMRLHKYFFSDVLKMFTVMEHNGAFVDINQLRYLKSKDSPLLLRMEECLRELNKLDSVKRVNKRLLKKSGGADMPTLFGSTPELFDINKVEHKRELFWKDLGLDPVDYGKPERKTGNPNCHHEFEVNYEKKTQDCVKCGAICNGKLDKDFQEAYVNVKEVSLYTEYSQLKKLSTSFINSWYGYVSKEGGHPDCSPDGRLRPNQNVTGTLTGRTATTDPNLAQIPRARGGYKSAIKNILIPPKGKVLIQVDGKTMEVRGLGVLSKDRTLANIYNGAAKLKVEYLKNPNKKLKEEFELKEDIHKFNGAVAFGKKIIDITKEERDAAKGVTFGLIYGMGAGTLAGNLGKDLKETKQIIKKVLGNMPDAEKWMKQVHEKAKKDLYVEDPMGVRRRLATFVLDNEDSYGWAHALSLRQSVNSLVQGFCARAMMLLAAKLNKRILKNDLEEKAGLMLINFVHDAIVIEVDAEYAWKTIQLLEKLLAETIEDLKKNFGMEFVLPLDLDFEVGVKLGELKKLDGTKQSFDKVMKDLGFKVG